MTVEKLAMKAIDKFEAEGDRPFSCSAYEELCENIETAIKEALEIQKETIADRIYSRANGCGMSAQIVYTAIATEIKEMECIL